MKLRALLPLLIAAQSLATNGYFDHGYGIKSKGMAGVGIALPQDTLAPAANPAGLVHVADSADIGLTLFRPDRGATVGGNYFDANGDAAFLIPNFGWKTTVGKGVALGLPIFGNGGMNTTYSAPIPGFDPTTNLTMNLEQAFVAPTLAIASDEGHAIGLSLIYARQSFESTGTGLPSVGEDTSNGFGARIGFTAKVTERLTLGATYQSEIRCEPFKKYSGLFAEQGDFDIPATYGAGAAYDLGQGTIVALDVTRILYTGVRSVSNSMFVPERGFGWQDVTAYKLGVLHKVSEQFTVRAGYNHSTQPIQSEQTYINVIAPGVVRDHLTLGFTWKLASGVEISGFYAKALEEEVTGSGPSNGIDLRMDQDSIGIGISWPL